MRLVTNPGTNLNAAEIARYHPFLVPQEIVVDGVEHDTREAVTHADVDRWVKSAKVHPYVLGTSAARFVDVFRQQAQDHEQMLAILGSRHLVTSYGSAASAVRTLNKLPGLARIEAQVLDTRSTDLGSGMSAIFAGEARKAGLPLAKIVSLCEQVALDHQAVFVPRDLDWLVKGGRASFLKAMMANLLGRSPLLGMDDGELKPFGTVKRSEALPALSAELVRRVGARRRVWLAIAHGGADRDALELAATLRKQLDVALCLVRSWSAAVYLNAGPDSLAAFVMPIDRIDWTPPMLTSEA